jgi:hypothetical protein
VNEWFEKQEFFTQAKMDRINSWIKQEPIDVFVYQVDTLSVAV